MTTDFSCFVLFLEFLLCSRILYGECRTNLLEPKAQRRAADTVVSSYDVEGPRIRNSNALWNATATTYPTTLIDTSTLKSNLFANPKNHEVRASDHRVEEFVTDGLGDDGEQPSTVRDEYGAPAKQPSKPAHSSSLADQGRENRMSASNDATEEKKSDRNRKPVSDVEGNVVVQSSAGKTIGGTTEGKRTSAKNATGTAAAIAASVLSRGKLKYQVGNAITESAASREYENGLDDRAAKAEVLFELPVAKDNHENSIAAAQNAHLKRNENNATRSPKNSNYRYEGVGGDGYTFETHFDVDTERDFTKYEDKPSKYSMNEPGNSIDKIRNFNHENGGPNVKIANIVKKPQGFTLTTPAPVETETLRRTVSRLGAVTNVGGGGGGPKRFNQPANANPTTVTRVEVPASTEMNPNSISKNEILRKPSVKPISSFNNRRKISPGATSSAAAAAAIGTANTSNENSLPTSSTVWALASLKTPYNQKMQKHSNGEGGSRKDAAASTIKPFVSWSTKLQKTPAPDPKDVITTTLKSLPEIDAETVSPIGFAESKASATNTSSSSGESKPTISVSSHAVRETYPKEGVTANADETKESFADATASIGHRPAQTGGNETTAKSSTDNVPTAAAAATAAARPVVENHLRFNSSYFNYTTDNKPEDNASVVINDNFFSGFDTFVSAINSPQNDEKHVENKNNVESEQSYGFYTVVSTTSTTTTQAPKSSEILPSTDENSKKMSATKSFDNLGTTVAHIDVLTANSTMNSNTNVFDENKYTFTEAAVMEHRNNDSGFINIESNSSMDTIDTFENTNSRAPSDSMSNTNASTNPKENVNSKIKVENVEDANWKNENNRTSNDSAQNANHVSVSNTSMTNKLLMNNGKNISLDNNEKYDVADGEHVHEIIPDYDEEYVTPGVVHRNETSNENRIPDVTNLTVSTSAETESEIRPITTTSKVILTKFTEMTPSTTKILPQPITSTTTSTESQTQTGLDPFNETEPPDVFAPSPASVPPSRTSGKHEDIDVVKDVETESPFTKDYHTTLSNIEKFPSIIVNTLPTSTTPSPELSTTSASTTESNIRVTGTRHPNKEPPATASTFKPKLPPESVPGYLMLFFKSTFAEVCQTSSALKENLFQFITQRSVRVQSKDQVIVMVDPEQCKEPDNSLGLIPIALYLVDDFGSYDKTLIDEMKTLLLKDENYTLPIHEIVYHENIKPDNSRLIAAVVITSIAAICLVLLIFLMCTIRNRQKLNYGQRCTPVSIDDYNLDNISEYNSIRRKGNKMRASKRSYGNPTFDDPSVPSKTLTYNALLKACENRRSLDEEFSQIPVITVKSEELPLGAEVKNRYANVIPLPETRVSLSSNNNSVDSVADYINANYVEGYMGAEKFYIACQAPLSNTIEDFWKMVWKEQTKVIVMLTGLMENGIEKCADYLPPSEVLDCHRLFGDFQITLKKREVKEKYVISCLQLKNMVNNLWREVTHLWYTSWPAQGVPNEQSSIIALLIEARAYMRNSRGAHIVHCSPGTGRTGTVIAIDVCIRDYESTRSVNIPSTVSKLRRCRAGAVQTKEQYAFIYKVLSLYAKKLHGGTALDSM